MKCQVTGTVTFNFDVEVEAEHEDAAMQMVEEMEYADLIERAPAPRMEVDGCLEVRARPPKKSRKTGSR
jgi:hypothetical protein